MKIKKNRIYNSKYKKQKLHKKNILKIIIYFFILSLIIIINKFLLTDYNNINNNFINRRKIEIKLS